jgi:hypothetical protein
MVLLMSPADGSPKTIQRWKDVGVHPTPSTLVDMFAESVVREFVSSAERASGSLVRVLDACAGDGRLGIAVAARLVALNYIVELTCVEVSATFASGIEPGGKFGTRVQISNFLLTSQNQKFDVVVSNPPYESLSARRCRYYGIAWRDAVCAGKNLYGFGILRCIDACLPGQVVGVIAPHGWLQNSTFANFRESVVRNVGSISIRAFSSRNLFPGVSQDTSFQIFRKRHKPSEDGSELMCDANISYDEGGKTTVCVRLHSPELKPLRVGVRVGPLVWNRTNLLLQASPVGGVLLVSGGNIGSGGQLVFGARYVSRQYVSRKDLPPAYLTRGPVVLIKRTMRGSPGRWILDYILIASRKFVCVAENHVIAVSVPRRMKAANRAAFVKKLIKVAVSEHLNHGHPNVSVELVRLAVRAALS